jgi:hypothetical protein
MVNQGLTIHIKNVTKIYKPIKRNEGKKNASRYMINLDKYDEQVILMEKLQRFHVY